MNFQAPYTQIFTTLKVTRHPSYNGQKIQNDIAIFELTVSIGFFFIN